VGPSIAEHAPAGALLAWAGAGRAVDEPVVQWSGLRPDAARLRRAVRRLPGQVPRARRSNRGARGSRPGVGPIDRRRELARLP